MAEVELKGSVKESLRLIEDLKFFLATAPANWQENQVIRRYYLNHDEGFVSCVFWNNLYFITGTDIVRCIVYKFEHFGRKIVDRKKFEEGIFSDLRALKCGTDAILEPPRSEFLSFLFRNACLRTQKKQKVFFWFNVPHDKLMADALERDLKKELANQPATTVAHREPALSFQYDDRSPLFQQLVDHMNTQKQHQQTLLANVDNHDSPEYYDKSIKNIEFPKSTTTNFNIPHGSNQDNNNLSINDNSNNNTNDDDNTNNNNNNNNNNNINNSNNNSNNNNNNDNNNNNNNNSANDISINTNNNNEDDDDFENDFPLDYVDSRPIEERYPNDYVNIDVGYNFEEQFDSYIDPSIFQPPASQVVYNEDYLIEQTQAVVKPLQKYPPPRMMSSKEEYFQQSQPLSAKYQQNFFRQPYYEVGPSNGNLIPQHGPLPQQFQPQIPSQMTQSGFHDPYNEVEYWPYSHEQPLATNQGYIVMDGQAQEHGVYPMVPVHNPTQSGLPSARQNAISNLMKRKRQERYGGVMKPTTGDRKIGNLDETVAQKLKKTYKKL